MRLVRGLSVAGNFFHFFFDCSLVLFMKQVDIVRLDKLVDEIVRENSGTEVVFEQDVEEAEAEEVCVLPLYL